MAYINRRTGIHASKFERWMGADKIEQLLRHMDGWYGPPICLGDVPGSVYVTGDGDFIGDFERGAFASALDRISDHVRQFWRRVDRERAFREHTLGVGFTSISDALARASSGNGQWLSGNIVKVGATGVASASSSLWRVASNPPLGAAGSAAPGGRALTKATTGAMNFNNPGGSDTLHLVGADLSANVVNNCIMLYDRLFDVAKTMNSTAVESVTGVPTRYQSSTSTDPNYAGGNFLFIEVGATALAATAHNWTSCTYRDQAGTDARILPSVVGVSGAIADRFDMPVSTWFCPLAAGDTGIMDLAQMQCSAAVATGFINFVIGHPIKVFSFPVVNSLLPFDCLTNMDQAPRIFNDAALALFELPKPSATATIYTGMMRAVSAAA